jgi:hypothetical protein
VLEAIAIRVTQGILPLTAGDMVDMVPDAAGDFVEVTTPALVGDALMDPEALMEDGKVQLKDHTIRLPIP